MKPSHWTGFLPGAHPGHFCKPHVGEAAWPSLDSWNALNQSVSGRLLAPTPPAAVCHPTRPEYNNASCADVTAQWNLTSFQASQPVSVDYNDETCRPDPTTPCSGDGYPEYVIVAETVQDVQAGVNFAHETGVRLVIKGTGHDYPGRSSGSDSLSIYTHHLRGLSTNTSDPRATALGGSASVKIFAGEQLGGVYRYAATQNVTVIGGADPDVGIGGWISGGGHGPLTAKYGMGADQVLEMEVVTADGQFRTINADCDADLFWAMRGGGAGTYAVLISVTVKAYPPIDATNQYFTYTTTADTDTFWSLATYFHTQLPSLAEAGIYGYYYITPRNMNNASSGTVAASYVGPNLSADQIKAIIAPMESHIQSAGWRDPVYPFNETLKGGNFMTFWPTNPAQAAGWSGRLGSRLLTNSSLLGDFDKLKNALRTSTPAGEEMLGHLVGPAPNTQHPIGAIAGGSDAVLPAWRRTYSHAVLTRRWTSLNTTQKTLVTNDLRDICVKALRDLEPDSGAYMSESDPTEPEWQKTKFGENYEKLVSLKSKWDPEGVFWCKQCIGDEEQWEVNGAFGIENGVGQNKVKLCRKRGGWKGHGREWTA